MLFFKNKKEKLPDLSWVSTDIHSHLIPGIDDGSQDMETSLKMVRGLADLGYKKFITTPHILWEVYPNTPEIINNGLIPLNNKVKEENLQVEVHAAAEYFLDEHFVQLITSGSQLLTISDGMVLIEFSMLTAPLDLQEQLFELQMRNYNPIIAHPERYSYMNRKREFFDNLKDAGYLFQLNLMSLTGYYGPVVQELAEYLIKKDYYNFVGTDLHSLKHLAQLQKLATSDYLKRLKDSGNIKNCNL